MCWTAKLTAVKEKKKKESQIICVHGKAKASYKEEQAEQDSCMTGLVLAVDTNREVFI